MFLYLECVQGDNSVCISMIIEYVHGDDSVSIFGVCTGI